MGAALLRICLEIPRIDRQVLAFSELQRIDEDRDHQPIALLAGDVHERGMPRMEPPHGGHQSDPESLGPPGTNAVHEGSHSRQLFHALVDLGDLSRSLLPVEGVIVRRKVAIAHFPNVVLKGLLHGALELRIALEETRRK